MIYISANILSNKFLREIVAINLIFLCKCQKIVSSTIKVTLNSNCHSLIAKLLDLLLLVKYMPEDFLFYEQLSWTKL